MKHKDEHEAAKVGTDAMAGDGEHKTKPKHKKGKVIGMNIRRAENKGYTAHHVHEHPEMEGVEQVAPKPHILADQEALHEHIDQHMPEAGGGGAQEGGGGEEPVE